MDERQYSRAIDVHRISEYPEVQNVINSLLSELNDSNLIKNSPRKRILKHLKVVILDLYVAYLGDPLVYVSYPRSKDAYRQDQRMKQLFLGYGPMTTVINGLASLGYLQDHRGFYDQGRKTGFQSRMRATSKLIDLIENYSVVPSMIALEDDQLIILRDADKEAIDYEETDETSAMETALQSYNVFLSKYELALSLPTEEVRGFLQSRRIAPFDFTRNRLYRIFNEDFTSGGRFYRGWWQNIPRELRQHITIDREPCSELDYSGQHLLLLYGLEGDEYRWLKGLNDDPYYLEAYGEDGRSLLKVAVLILVNETNEDKAIRAIRQKINYDFSYLDSTDDYIKSLIEALKDKHPEIKDQLFTGKGGELQYQDSQIAEYVLKDMQARGQPVLPVHDSFIVQDKYLAHLYSSMKEAYRMLGVDSIPEVKIKAGANTTYDKPYFMQLWDLMDAERKINQKELEGIKELEDLV